MTVGLLEKIVSHESMSKPAKAMVNTNVRSISAEPQTLDELLRARSRDMPNSPLVSYPHDELNYVDYTARQLDQYAYHVAQGYALSLKPRNNSSQNALVIGLLGLSSLDYLVTAMAIQKLGHTALHLSTRISHEAYLDLLARTQTTMVLVDNFMRDTITKCQIDMPDLRIGSIATAAEYIRPVQHNLDTNLTPLLDPDVEESTVAWIIHSSGSTGLPKPVYQTQKAAMNNYRGNMNMRGFITLPLFHSHGISSTYRAIYSGKQIHIYNAKYPLTKQYLMEVMRRFDFEIFYGVPYVLNLLAESQEGIELLAKCKIVMFGGSACPEELGNLLVDNAVNLVSHWGSTETGQLMTSFRPAVDRAWNYLRPAEQVKPYLRMEARGEGLYEAVCLPGWPSKVATNRPDGSYVMKDLFTKHPDHNWWKYYGRLDDTIVLVNGEKAMPLPIEGAARQNPYVNEAVVFGKGRDQLGLAIIRASENKAMPPMSRDEIVKSVMISIGKTQSEMPAYAQISQDMILVLDADTDYPRTDKGTVIRIKFYKRFEQEIDAAYQAIENQKGSLKLDEDGLRIFLRQALRTSSTDIDLCDDDQDFFNAGMDSLQATRLRSAIIKDIDIGDNQLGINVAFEQPSISKLTTHLFALRTGQCQEDNGLAVEDEMQQLIDKYRSFTPHTSQPRIADVRSVVLTGVTGSLGAHMASIIANDPSITRVYCLIRASSTAQAEQRLAKSLTDRGILSAGPTSSARTSITASVLHKLVALPANLSHPNLGLASDTYLRLQAETVSIVHSAWSVNFNLHLTSFHECIQSAHNLIQLALSTKSPTPASFNFCSSISTVMNTPKASPSSSTPTLIPESVPPLTHAQSMGYAQSKLVTEHLCQIAADLQQRHNQQQQQQVPGSQEEIAAVAAAAAGATFSPRVLRIGQIIGDTHHGIWNKQEAIPTMIQSAKTIGCLPTLDEDVRWLPVDVVAKCCVDIALQAPSSPVSSSSSPINTCKVYNILNPQTCHWTRDLLPTLKTHGLEFEQLDVTEWLARLKDSNPDPAINAPVKLLDFWMGKYGARVGSREQLGSLPSTMIEKSQKENMNGEASKQEKKAKGFEWNTSNTTAISPYILQADGKAVLDVVKLSLDYFREKCW